MYIYFLLNITELGQNQNHESSRFKSFFTFSVEAQAAMVEPELTEVGELHSLTDWQVSEASEEAELDEFCWGSKKKKKSQKGTTKRKKREERQANETKTKTKKAKEKYIQRRRKAEC